MSGIRDSNAGGSKPADIYKKIYIYVHRESFCTYKYLHIKNPDHFRVCGLHLSVLAKTAHNMPTTHAKKCVPKNSLPMHVCLLPTGLNGGCLRRDSAFAIIQASEYQRHGMHNRMHVCLYLTCRLPWSKNEAINTCIALCTPLNRQLPCNKCLALATFQNSFDIGMWSLRTSTTPCHWFITALALSQQLVALHLHVFVYVCGRWVHMTSAGSTVSVFDWCWPW